MERARHVALLRRILFPIFLLIYAISCPILILYSLGYIFNPLKQGLTQTGLLYLSTVPQGADIFLGKSRYVYKTPATINELLPGRYTVRLHLKGYKEWVHKLTITPGKAAAFEDVILAPRAWKAERLSNRVFVTMRPLTGTDFILLSDGSKLGNYFIYDWKGEKITPVLPKDSEFYDFPVGSIFTQKDSSQFVVYGGPLWEKKYLAIDPGEPPVDITADFTASGESLPKEEIDAGLSPDRPIRTGMKGEVFHKGKKLLAFWTARSLWIASPPDYNTPLKPVYKSRNNIKECFWSRSGSHIIINDDNQIFLLELEPQGPAHVNPVAKTKEGAAVFYAEEKDAVYYLDGETGILSKITLTARE